MARDFVPSPDSELRQWLFNLKTSVHQNGLQMGLDAGEVTEAELLCDEYVAQIDTTEQARLTSQSEVQKKKAMRKTHQPRLRHLINKMKATKLSKANAKSMNVMWKGEALDEDTYQLRLKAVAKSDHIEVKFPKRGIAAVDFRVKISDDLLKGEWLSLGLRLQSPLRYKPEGYQQGSILRVWFMGVAVIKDKPFGKWSDAVSVLYVVAD